MQVKRDLVGRYLLVGVMGAMAYCAASPERWTAFVTLAFLAGGLVLWIWKQKPPSILVVLIYAAVFRLMFAWLPPVLSDDAYRYVWDGILQVSGFNPYLLVPQDPALAAFQQLSIFPLLNSATFYSIYPPLSQLYFAVGGLFHQESWLVSYYVIKGLLMLSEFGAVLLLARMVPPRTLLLYAWHPLAIIESAGQLHTEAIMVLFLVLTVWFVQNRRGGWAAATLACAGWVKLYPFFLFPLLIRRFGWWTVGPASLVSLLLLAPYYDIRVPAHIFESLNLYVRYFEFNAGLYYGVKQVFMIITGDDWSKTLGPLFRLVFLAVVPAVYVMDARFQWRFSTSSLVLIGAFLMLATTVHPWYLLGLLTLTLMNERPAWPWLWLGVASIGTYLLYVDGPYWFFVWIGWGGFFLSSLILYGSPSLQALQRFRAGGKFEQIRRYLPEDGAKVRILDLGAGEGYVGAAMKERLGAEVVLADVLPMNRTALPVMLYDGRTLPVADGAFDFVILYYVLHHCEDQEAVFQEALRVARRGVILVESVYRRRWDYLLLQGLDRLANRIRSGGRMKGQEAHLHFRTIPAWHQFFQEQGAVVSASHQRGRWIHQQAYFLLERG